MVDKRQYAVNYDVTSTIKSSVTIDLDEVREWMEWSGCTEELDHKHLVEFLLSGREGPWDDLNWASVDSEDGTDYHNLRIVGEA